MFPIESQLAGITATFSVAYAEETVWPDGETVTKATGLVEVYDTEGKHLGDIDNVVIEFIDTEVLDGETIELGIEPKLPALA